MGNSDVFDHLFADHAFFVTVSVQAGLHRNCLPETELVVVRRAIDRANGIDFVGSSVGETRRFG